MVAKRNKTEIIILGLVFLAVYLGISKKKMHRLKHTPKLSSSG